MKDIVIYSLLFFILLFLSLGINQCLKDNCVNNGGTIVTRGLEMTGCIEGENNGQS